MKKLLLMSLVLVFTLLHQAMAQDRTISGTVIDKATNTGLPGVSVSVKGLTGVGTATDVNGGYTLSVPAGSNTLEFRFIGYKTLERTIGTESNISVTMDTDAKQLGEVVVTAMGVERQERGLGYATTSVKSEEITKGRTSSPMNALQGKVAGMNVSAASGSPGASTKVILRGYSSITGNNNPLYVIDGIPMNNSATNLNEGTNTVNRTQDFGNRANDINPDDIESISILKGASATALYGSRAASGVIIITTKKGKASEKIGVDYTTSATFSRPLRLPQTQQVFGQGWNGHFASEENGSWGPMLDGKDRLWGNIVNNSQQIKPFSAQKDNLKDFYETGKSFINTIALSGGSEKTSFYASYGNVSENGVVPTDADSYKRNTLALRGSTRGNKLSISSNLNYVRKDAKAVTTGQGGEGQTLFQEMIQIPVDHSIVDYKDLNNPFNTLDNFYTPYAQNPYWSLTQNGNDFDENRIFGGVDFSYNFTDWLTATLRGGGDVAHSVIQDWIAKGTYTPGSPNSSNTDIPGRVTERNRFSRDLDANLILTANNNINEDLRLTTLVGYNVNERYARNGTAFTNNLTIPNFYNLANSSVPVEASTATSLRRLYGIYGQADLNFRDYLFLTVVARNDWSSTLPTEDNSFFYPGVNGSFVFTDVFSNLKGVMNFGKLRAAWGKTGNDAAPYQVNSVFVPGTVGLGFGNLNFPLSGVSAYERSNQIGNLSLAPEITREFEFGGNFEFLDSRIKSDISFYNRSTKGQILPVPIALSSGYSTLVSNLGEISNKGIELGLTVTPIRTDDFNWDIRYTFSNNRNKVEELTEGLDEITITSIYGINFVATVGEPLGVFKGPGYTYSPDGKLIVSAAGYPVPTTEKEIYGNSQPDFMMGLSNEFSYKNINFSFLFDYRKGGLMYSYTQRLTQFVGNTTNTLYNDRLPFVIPNSVVQNADGTFSENVNPVDVGSIVDYWNPQSNAPIEREHLFSRTYLKLREVALGYTLPADMVSKTPFAGVNISLVGRNLFLKTPKENNIIDPETTTFGNDLTGEFGEFAGGPSVRSMGATLRVTF
ncbi:SusC/RagA family TonB-linked outer membrane protein [Adhaeribacter terreus]|uniref:SusC/RagA family TonB-linked outer membrane protein n=1 Tax=Adhaeribacter terreus TaxID=529703 RepID=A0ABW0EG90_9BACT